jgi:hypothetical protein
MQQRSLDQARQVATLDARGVLWFLRRPPV